MSLGGCKLSMCILIISFQVNWSQDSEIKHLHPPRFREQGGYTLGFSYLVKNIFAFPFWIMFSSMLKDWGGGWKTSKTPIDCRERKGSSLLPPPPSRFLFQTSPQMLQSSFWSLQHPRHTISHPMGHPGLWTDRVRHLPPAEWQSRMGPSCSGENYVVGLSAIAGPPGVWYFHVESQNSCWDKWWDTWVMRHNSSATSASCAQGTVAQM